jgi:hypothetical protein
LILVPFSSSADVSTYQYNNVIDEFNDLKYEYNDLVDKYKSLVDKYNRMTTLRYREGQCWGYGLQVDKITGQLYKNTSTDELGKFLNIEVFNRFFLSRTKEQDLLGEPRNIVTLFDALNQLRVKEAKAAENIGYARSGLEMVRKFLDCSDDYDNKEVVRGKKDLLTGIIKEIQQSQTLVDKLYDGLIKVYKTESQFELVLDTNDYDINKSRDIHIYEYVMNM